MIVSPKLLLLALASLALVCGGVVKEDLQMKERIENIKSQVDQIKMLPKQQASNFLSALDQLLASLINAIPRIPTTTQAPDERLASTA